MNRKKQVLILLSFLFLTFSEAYAQDDKPKDNSYYFDDDGISEGRNILKLNLLSIIVGDLPIYYERCLGNSFSIEVGAGIQLPYYVTEIPQALIDELEVKNPDSGYSLWLQPKYYIQGEAPEYSYFGLQLRRRNYNYYKKTITHTDIIYNYGFNLILGKRILFDYSSGIGVRFGDDVSGIDGFIFPFSIKLGYIL